MSWWRGVLRNISEISSRPDEVEWKKTDRFWGRDQPQAAFKSPDVRIFSENETGLKGCFQYFYRMADFTIVKNIKSLTFVTLKK